MKKTLQAFLCAGLLLAALPPAHPAELQKSYPYAPRTPGTSGQGWISNGAGSVPTWQGVVGTGTANTYTALQTYEAGVSIITKPLVIRNVTPDFESGISAQVTNTQRLQAYAGGTSVFTVDNAGFHGAIGAGSSFNVANNAIPAAAVSLYDGFLDQSKTRSGASLISVGATDNNHLSGTSLVSNALNCFVSYGRNNAAQIIGLPPVSGTSTWFVQFHFEGNTGGVAFEGTESAGIFYGREAGTLEHNKGRTSATSGITGVYVPAGSQFLEITFKGVSGVTNYIWFDSTSGVSMLERG